MSLQIRDVNPSDTPLLAHLHTLSWSSAYRGIIPDAWLDEELAADRAAFWQARAEAWPPRAFGLLAIDGEQPIGFIFALPDADPPWGTLIDNLHVLPGFKRQGTGRQLLTHFADRALLVAPAEPVHLWVYEENHPARRFYDAMGGHPAEQILGPLHGGGEVPIVRYTWSSPSTIQTLIRHSFKDF